MLYKINNKLVISTSRKPTQITRRFAQFLKHYFNAIYINRGKSSFSKIVNETKKYENSLLLIITETKGNPSSINLYDVAKDVENPLLNIYINISLPQENSKINTNSEKIVIINKAKDLEEIFINIDEFEGNEKIKENCLIITDKEETVCRFIDKKGNDTKFKIFIKGFKVNN